MMSKYKNQLKSGFKSVLVALSKKYLFLQKPISYIMEIPTKISFFKSKGSSIRFWEDRYKTGGTSGWGSYGTLKQYKSDVINSLINENGIQTVLEFGCGDGNQLLSSIYSDYTGLDVSPTAIEICRNKFKSDNAKTFFVYEPSKFDSSNFSADLTLSLDVIFHILEDDIFNLYMTHLFSCSRKFIPIYSFNENRTTKNPYVKHRKFTEWIDTNVPNFKLIKKIENIYTEKKGCDFFLYAITKSNISA